jgi:hypothetical protein
MARWPIRERLEPAGPVSGRFDALRNTVRVVALPTSGVSVTAVGRGEVMGFEGLNPSQGLIAFLPACDGSGDTCTATTANRRLRSIPTRREASMSRKRRARVAAAHQSISGISTKKVLARCTGERHNCAKPARLTGGKRCKRETAPWTMWKSVSSAK